MIRALLISPAIVLCCALAFAQNSGSASSAAPPQSGPSLAQDRHDGLTVSADPYTDAARSKQKFGKADPFPIGLLPVEVFLKNDTALPLHVELATVKLSLHGRDGTVQDIDHLSLQEVAAAVAHPNGPAAPGVRRFPIGLPTGGDKKTDKMREILQPFSLDSDLIPPMGMIRGFLFFNLSHDMTLASNASLYIPDVTKVPSNQPLMFFEVALDKTQQR